MSAFALFRLPYEQHYTLVEQISGDPLELVSCTELSGRTGFVVAPFDSDKQSLLLIRPDRVAIDVLPENQGDRLHVCSFQPNQKSVPLIPTADSRQDYHIDFANFHAHLMNDDFTKLVLSRSLWVGCQNDISPIELFLQACERYPRVFVSLVYTSQSGMWLTATPEILLAGSGEKWQTVALAGTMPYEDDVRWSDKNIQEQRYVATYITEQLERFTPDFKEEGPKTIRAGHLAHLRSDFHFRLEEKRIGELLQALHPTPAVCGLPKQKAFRFILQNEHHVRRYYSGFMGPLMVENKTSLFVTLRCMEIFSNGYRLYAGGGILKDSTEEQEWQETEIKMDTMRNIINHV